MKKWGLEKLYKNNTIRGCDVVFPKMLSIVVNWIVFAYFDEYMIRKIIVILICTKLKRTLGKQREYKKKTTTKMVPRLKGLTHENILKELNFLSLEKERTRL